MIEAMDAIREEVEGCGVRCYLSYPKTDPSGVHHHHRLQPAPLHRGVAARFFEQGGGDRRAPLPA